MVMLMGVLVAGVHVARGTDAAPTTSPPEMLTAGQVLDRFEATQRRINGSFISRFESESVGELDHSPPFESGRRTSRTVVEIRTDGQRFFWCEENFGQCYPKLTETTPATDPRVKWFLYDGRDSYTGGHEPFAWIKRAVQRYDPTKRPKAYNDRIRITISDCLETNSPFATTFNRCGSRSDAVPDSLGTGGLVHEEGLAQKLRNAKTLVLEPKCELVNGVPCYVLQAALAQTWKQRHIVDCAYLLHFDPTHDYHIAKLKLTVTLQFPAEKPGVQACTENRQAVDNVRFQKIGEDWVPMAWQRSSSTRRLDDPRIRSWSKDTVRRTRVLLNPDHDALGSFKPAFIQDGWTVELRGFAGRFHQAGPLAWKDGGVVNTAGQKLALR